MTSTPNKGLTLPIVNSDFGIWGGELNNDLAILDNALGGVATINVAGNSNVTATAAQAQNLTQLLTGQLTGNISYVLPAVGGLYIIENQSLGAFSITVVTSAAGSVGINVPQNKNLIVYSDGVNVYNPSVNSPAPAVTWQVISTQTISNQPNAVFVLPNAFTRFRITAQNASISTSAAYIGMQLSYDGGTSFQTSLYNSIITYVESIGSSVIVGVNTTPTVMPLSTLLGSQSSGNILDASFELYPGSSTTYPRLRGSGYGFDQNNANISFQIGAGVPVLGVPKVMQIVGVGTSFSGTFILEGLP
jgi:hypothetical protein